MIKIGVIGAGHLGKIHIKLIKENPKFELVGFYDTDKSNSVKVEHDFHVNSFDDLDDLIQQVDAVDIVTPTITHFEIAKKAISKIKHVFVEKPLTATLEEAKTLQKMVYEAGVIAQVGHVERFNSAFLALGNHIFEPTFLEVHRLAQWNPRGTDVSVVLDLMIHDIDIVMSLVNSGVKRVLASGVAVVSDTPDIANARIEFFNGAVANLTASRISMKNMRKLRFFQKNAYISVDFLDKKTDIIQISNDAGVAEKPGFIGRMDFQDKSKYLSANFPTILPTNAIGLELENFADSIAQNKKPIVSFEDGYKALQTAYQVIESIGNYER